MLKKHSFHPAVKAILCSLLSYISCIALVDGGLAERVQSIAPLPLRVLHYYASVLGFTVTERLSPYAALLYLPMYYWYYSYFRRAHSVTRGMRGVSGLIAFLLFFALYPITIGDMFVKRLLSIHIFLEIPLFIGFYALVKSAVVTLFAYFDGLKVEKRQNTLSNKAYFLWIFFAMLLAWAPFVLLEYPGSLPADTAVQLQQMQTGEYYAGNPLFLTLVYGWIFSLGRLLHSANLGIFLGVAVQMLACAAAFSYILIRLRGMRLPKYVTRLTFVFYAFTPVWTTFLHALLKDVAHTAAFSWFVVEYMEAAHAEELPRKLLIRLACSAVIMALTRVTGTYLLLPCFAVLLLYQLRRKQKKAALSLGAILLAAMLVNPLLGLSLKATRRDNTDNIGWMFQMTALYAINHQDSIPQEEIDIINRVLDYDKIIKDYSPTLSDHVKYTFSVEKRSDFVDYLKLWIKQFFKDPDAYFTAFLNNSYSYWNPIYDYRFIPTNNIDSDFAGEVHYKFPSQTRGFSILLLNLWRGIPPLGWLFKGSTYAYLLFIAYAYACHRRKVQAKLMMLPLLLLFVGCLFSPVSGDFRYMAPYAACVPLALGCAVEAKEDKAALPIPS